MMTLQDYMDDYFKDEFFSDDLQRNFLDYLKKSKEYDFDDEHISEKDFQYHIDSYNDYVNESTHDYEDLYMTKGL